MALCWICSKFVLPPAAHVASAKALGPRMPPPSANGPKHAVCAACSGGAGGRFAGGEACGEMPEVAGLALLHPTTGQDGEGGLSFTRLLGASRCGDPAPNDVKDEASPLGGRRGGLRTPVGVGCWHRSVGWAHRGPSGCRRGSLNRARPHCARLVPGRGGAGAAPSSAGVCWQLPNTRALSSPLLAARAPGWAGASCGRCCAASWAR